MTTVAVVTPSRGLIHSRTVAAIMSNVASVDLCGWYISHDLPIPDCHEKVAELGLASGADALWFVEEDVIPPPGSLGASLRLLSQYQAVAINYPVGGINDRWGCLVHDADGSVLWAGLGATLIRREVFARIARPWFTTDYRYIHYNGDWKTEPHGPNDKRWGQQDIHFFMEFRRMGFRIGVVPDMIAGHAGIVRYGEANSNVGWHTVEIRTEIALDYPGVTGVPG